MRSKDADRLAGVVDMIRQYLRSSLIRIRTVFAKSVLTYLFKYTEFVWQARSKGRQCQLAKCKGKVG